MDRDPSEEELRAFVEAMLSNVGEQLREPAVIDDAIRERHEMWVLLYRASFGFEVRDEPASRRPSSEGPSSRP